MTIATGLKLRGARGELTATRVSGGIDQISGRDWVLIGRPGEGVTRRYDLETYRAYREKVVLKLVGIDSASQAEPLVGLDILMPCNKLVDLPEGTYYIFELVGLRVRTVDGRDLGTVRDVQLTAGTPLLVVTPDDTILARKGGDSEILLPVARSICTTIDITSRRITVDPPEGLLELYGI